MIRKQKDMCFQRRKYLRERQHGSKEKGSWIENLQDFYDKGRPSLKKRKRERGGLVRLYVLELLEGIWHHSPQEDGKKRIDFSRQKRRTIHEKKKSSLTSPKLVSAVNSLLRVSSNENKILFGATKKKKKKSCCNWRKQVIFVCVWVCFTECSCASSSSPSYLVSPQILCWSASIVFYILFL